MGTLAVQGGFVEAFAGYCASIDRNNARYDELQLEDWQRRNHWESAKSRMSSGPALQKQYQDSRDTEKADLQAHRFKSVFACAALPQVLHQAIHDPSLQHGRELAELDVQPGAAPSAAASGSMPAGVPARAPGGMGTGTAPAAGRSNDDATAASLGVGASASPTGNEGQLTVGAMTVTPPPGWTIEKNTPDMALLKTRTQHTPAVILLTTAPMNGDLQQSLYSAIRANFQGTGMTFKYPHMGMTGGGSPAMYILDNGILNRQRESIAAVGIAIGGKLQMALLVSGQWGGDDVMFRRQMDQMMSAATLHGEANVWDPVHPPKPVGARSGFFFGARVQNQLNPLGGMDLNAVREYALLLPTGQVYYGLPIGGHVMDMDFAAACRTMPQRCGTYSIQNGTITFLERDAYGLVMRTTSPFLDGPAGHARIQSYHSTNAGEVLPVHDLRLSGKFTSTFAQTGNTGISTSVVAQTFISFQPNGTYQKSGFSSASFSGGGGGGTTMNNRGLGSGQYKFEGYTLTLTPSSGPPELYTTVFENQDPNPKAIFINDKAFLRDGSY